MRRYPQSIFDESPKTTEKLDREHRSGDTLEEPDWDTPYDKGEKGTVQNGTSFIEPMSDHQPMYSKKKVYK
jgi:hypothetical protein